jgi:hypothetical protein
MEEKQLQLVTHEQAQRLKQLGFNWECETFYIDGNIDNSHNMINYNNNEGLFWNKDDYDEEATDDGYCSAPTVALALKWMRDEKGIRCAVNHETWYSTRTEAESNNYYPKRQGEKTGLGYSIYEAAETALLDELLTILEEEKE